MSRINIRIISLAVVLSATGAIGYLTAGPARSQLGVAKNYVQIQATSPGTAQSGHATISGTVLAGQFVGGGGGLTGVNALSLGGLNSSAFLQAVPNPLSLIGDAPGLGILAGSNSSSAGGIGVLGRANAATSDTSGVLGLAASTTGRGVYGLATASTGINYGGYFDSSSSSGYGIYAETEGTYAVSGKSWSAGGLTYGGHFETISTGGRGVQGIASASSGTTFGGFFVSQSSSGTGVHAETPGPYGVIARSSRLSSTSYGGYFITESTTGHGVYGTALATSTTATPYGVRGQASTATNGFGVYATGDLGASGLKPFRIDHPHDPLNKYLLHFSSESPFPQNFYNGNVMTDKDGYAWVELPEYFEDINTNFKYQLTVVEDDETADFILVKVVQKIRGNRFRIRTSKPMVEVSWEVKADRNDDRVRFNRPMDVREKTGLEKGKYQHPEYHNARPEMGIDYASRPQPVMQTTRKTK